MKHIVLTGGGTAGHVTPNIALIPTLKAAGYQISYIGSYEGIERKLIEEMGIPYYGISSGKLRRYFDPKNFSDPFRVLKGFHEAKKLLKKLKPDVVFSKGGFVTVPVVIAAKRCKIPAIIHESDMTPGLANKLCIPSAVKVCCNFPETVSSLPADKAVLTGTPIRQELMKGDKEAGRQFCGFTSDKPVLMVIGALCTVAAGFGSNPPLTSALVLLVAGVLGEAAIVMALNGSAISLGLALGSGLGGVALAAGTAPKGLLGVAAVILAVTLGLHLLVARSPVVVGGTKSPIGFVSVAVVRGRIRYCLGGVAAVRRSVCPVPDDL